MQNPLLHLTENIFMEVKSEHFEPAIDAILQQNRQKIAQLIEEGNPDFKNIIGKMEDIDVELQNIWSVISHLQHVKNLPEMREPYEKCLEKLTEYEIEIGQNKRIFDQIEKIKNSKTFTLLTTVEKKIIDDYLLDFKLSGIHLPESEKKRYQDIQKKLSKLSTDFSNHLLDATDAWTFHIQQEQELLGIPEANKNQMAKRAKEKNLSGWLITLDFPTYYSVITYADNRELRKEIHYAYMTRASDLASDHPEWDNTEIINEILNLRQEMAHLLGFENYAQLSLERKMARNTHDVLNFLHDLGQKSLTSAKNEIEELKTFAANNFNITDLQAYDISYMSEKLRQKKFSIDDEMLRKFFPEKKVLQGLFKVIQNLFSITLKEKPNINAWHEDVKYFDLYDSNHQHIGSLYLDLYARPQKRSGAWMDSFRTRHRFQNGTLQLPIAYVICNFTPGEQDYGSLLTHEEVQTLFHEFGHALHHLLTAQEYSSISGIEGVPWDGVEFPSQFMENFCWAPETLSFISSHVETGESLPAQTLENLLAAKNFQSAMSMMRQLEFSLIDYRLHLDTNFQHHKNWVQTTIDNIRNKFSVIPYVPYNRFQHNFSHIFCGGYAAGYYSYKWAEVLSADAFTRFQQEGVLNSELGLSFCKCILQKGGSEDFLNNFIEFMGRKPNVDALLKQEGIIK